MIVIICAKYKKNWSRTVEATKRTRFSKSRPNDLEDIGQGQRSSHATHPLMLLIICTKYGKNPSWTVDGSGSEGNWPKTKPNFWILKRALHATHLLKLLDKMCKYEMDPMSIVEDTERTRFCPQTDRRTDGQGDTSISPFQLLWSGGYKNNDKKNTRKATWKSKILKNKSEDKDGNFQVMFSFFKA